MARQGYSVLFRNLRLSHHFLKAAIDDETLSLRHDPSTPLSLFLLSHNAHGRCLMLMRQRHFNFCRERLSDNRQARLLLLLQLLRMKKKKERKRRVWCKPYLNRRIEKGSFQNIFQELSLESEDFLNYTRLNVAEFHHVLDKIAPVISKKDTVMRQAISAGAKLEACLRFLATGESYSSLRFATRISASQLGVIIPEVCDAIFDSLSEDYLKVKKIYLFHAYIIYIYI